MTNATEKTRSRRDSGVCRTSERKKCGIRRIAKDDPFLLPQDEAQTIAYIRSVLKHSGKLSEFDSFYHCLARGSTARISSKFCQQIKAVAKQLTSDRAMNFGLTRIPTSTLVCELISIGLSLIPDSDIVGIRPLNPPATIRRTALVKAMESVDLLDPDDEHDTLQVSYALILLHHATTCLRFKVGDPRNRQDGSQQLRSLIASALEHLKTPNGEDF